MKTAEKLDAELDQFQPNPSDPAYNLNEFDTTRKGAASQPVREKPTVYDPVKKPGAWDPTDIL